MKSPLTELHTDCGARTSIKNSNQ